MRNYLYIFLIVAVSYICYIFYAVRKIEVMLDFYNIDNFSLYSGGISFSILTNLSIINSNLIFIPIRNLYYEIYNKGTLIGKTPAGKSISYTVKPFSENNLILDTQVILTDISQKLISDMIITKRYVIDYIVSFDVIGKKITLNGSYEK